MVALALAITAALADPTPRIGPGGMAAQTCQWPSVVAVLDTSGEFCTGALVHPRVVVFAAHCKLGGKVMFGESAHAPAFTAQAERCNGHPNFAWQIGEFDYAYCVLPQAVEGLPITPVTRGCEAEIVPGSPVSIVGFGVQQNGGSFGDKRWATTTIASAVSGTSFTAGDAAVAGCLGDSGGPVLIEGDDGAWRVLAVQSGGPAGACGGYGIYGPIELATEWIEQDSGIDITPCHDAGGGWDPGPDCGGFAAAPHSPNGAWTAWCEGPVTGRASTCGPPGDGPGPGGADGGEDDDGGPAPGDDGPHGSDGQTDGADGYDAGGGTDDGSDSSASGAFPSPGDLGEDRDVGCGCRSAPTNGWAWIVLVLALTSRHRK